MTPATPLDDVEFLARSSHRVEVLRTLASGARSRADLHDTTGISQPTLGRILGAFEDRNWVERPNGEYALTPCGELIRAEFDGLLDTVDTVQRLGDVVESLPFADLDIDVGEFGDATVTRPENGNAFLHLRRIEELYYGADRARILSPTVAPGSIEEHRSRMAEFLHSDRHNEAIVSPEAMSQELTNGSLSWEPTGGPSEGPPPDEETAELIREALETGRVGSYLYEGEIPFMLGVADDVTMIAPTDERGVPTAVVETTNATARSWAEDLLDDYRDRSVKLTAETFL
ncbi:helix-turn-helix transcriptional regulator [Halobaculum roseum]|uniref:Helix-turn-helix transcriptional regulator n=1 Tax=Halobaculum roseum TaxID=2175149 RepID=A0ABD5MLH3_9EURY|nr:hypothetical protein [Halobaculum roseum]QZY01245.1 hypothetical protein K6T36_07685 [Halobaculum roseum]